MAPGDPVEPYRRSRPLKTSLPPRNSKWTPAGRAPWKVKWPILLPGLLWGLTACDQQAQLLDFQVVRTLPHDSGAYTQGLVFLDGLLLESTGGYGTSSLRKTDLETGEILQITHLDDEYFGEGLALVGSELYQLTWKSGLAFVYDLDSLALRRTFEYEGEGWGLCFDGETLFMSNGTDRLLRRAPVTFETLGELRVTENSFPVWRLNELECVGDHIFANVYQTTRILRIEKKTGRVVSEIDGFPLSAAARRIPDPGAVMHGIAYDPGSGAFFVTGKLWQSLFEIRVPGG